MTIRKLFAVGEKVPKHTADGEISITMWNENENIRWVDLKDGTRSFVIFPSSIRSSACDELVSEYNGMLTSCEWDDMIERISIL